MKSTIMTINNKSRSSMSEYQISREKTNVGLPQLANNSTSSTQNIQQQLIDTSSNLELSSRRTARRRPKSRTDAKSGHENTSATNQNGHISHNTTSDYTDVTKVKAQVSRYKDNVARTRLLSKPVNLVDSFYNLGAFGVSGRYINFNAFNECVLLVVNVATCDPRTTDEFRQLNDTVNQFHSKGFAVLGFMCNQFNNSQPWDNDEVIKSLKFIRPGQKYEPNFPIFTTCDVNGQHTSPVYDYLKSKQPFPFDDFVNLSSTPDSKSHSTTPQSTSNLLKYMYPQLGWSPVQRSDIGGNFERFLIDRTGQVVARYTRRKPMSTIIAEIEQLVSKRSREARSTISQEMANQANIFY